MVTHFFYDFNLEAASEPHTAARTKALMTQHIRHIRMSCDHSNRKMERMNGEIQDREKVIREVKR